MKMSRAASAVATCLFATYCAAAIKSNTTDPVQGHAPEIDSIALKGDGGAISAVTSGTSGITLDETASDLDGDVVTSNYSWFTVSGAVETEISGATGRELVGAVPALFGHELRGCATPYTDATTTLPSRGLRECASATILPPAPVISDLAITIPAGTDFLVEGLELSGRYTWDSANVGRDISRFAWGAKNSTTSISATSGTQITTSGEVPTFKITKDEIGSVVELSVLPVTDIQNVAGNINTVNTTDIVLDASAKPVINELETPWVNGVTANAILPAINFTVASGGGYPADTATYNVQLGSIANWKSGMTSTGNIPSFNLPSTITTDMLGSIVYNITPVNKKGVNGDVTSFMMGSVIDLTLPISVSELNVVIPSDLVVGSKLEASYVINANGNPGGSKDLYAWRYKPATPDNDSQKESYLHRFGGSVYAPDYNGVIPPRVITDVDAGNIIELLIQPRLNYDVTNVKGNIRAVEIGSVKGTPITITAPAAKPTIDPASVKFSKWERWGNSDVSYTFNANNGNPYDQTEFIWEVYRENDNHVIHRQNGSAMYNESIIGLVPADDDPEKYRYLGRLTLKPKNAAGIVNTNVVVSSKDMKLGPSGLGYIYTRVENVRHPAINSADVKLKLPSTMTVGSTVSATYTPNVFPGAMDGSKVKWMDGPEVTITTSGNVPSYVIQPGDVGKKIKLSIRNCDSGKLMPEETERILSCSYATVVSSDVSVIGSSAPVAELSHNGIGYTYMPAPKEEDGIYHTWAQASSGCSAKGAGWRLPTSDELVAISAEKVTRPATWPKDHLYWTSEKGTGTSYKTVYLEAGTVTDYGDGGSPDAPATTPAVCVKPSK